MTKVLAYEQRNNRAAYITNTHQITNTRTPTHVAPGTRGLAEAGDKLGALVRAAQGSVVTGGCVVDAGIEVNHRPLQRVESLLALNL